MTGIRKLTAVILPVCLTAGILAGCAEKPGTAENTEAETAEIIAEYVPKHILTNPNATTEAMIVYDYINSVYKNGIIAGQQESTWINNNPDDEMEYIERRTGKLPAIRGLDYINEDFDGVTSRSIEWWEKGGLVSICWHWGTPPDGVGYESSQETVDITELLTEGTDLYNGMIAQMDRVAEELLKLQEAGVPVLWRPFHEFDGGWFWWGKGTPEQFAELWRLMYDRYTNVFGLNNLIWVLGYSHSVRPGNWYPGDDYVDICGADNYAEGTQVNMYNKIYDIFGETGRPIAYHECGPIPDPDKMQEDGAGWVWFLTWHTMHIKQQNSPEYIEKIYNHDYVITLDELPSFKQELAS